MKLCIDFREPLKKLGLENAIKAVKAAGFDGIDFSFVDGVGKAYLDADDWQENAARIRRALDKEGLVCHQTHAPVGCSATEKLCPKTPAIARVIRSFAFSKILGAKMVVVHAITDVKPADFDLYNIRFYKLLEPYATEADVLIAVENLFKFDAKYHRFEGVFETGEKASAFISKLRSSCFVMCVDTGHAQLTGTPPEKMIATMNKGLVKAVHLHDNDGKDDLHLLPYSGVIDWDGVLSALKRIGYEGDLTFELPYFMEKFSEQQLPIALALAGEAAKRFQSVLEK